MSADLLLALVAPPAVFIGLCAVVAGLAGARREFRNRED